MRLAAVVLAGGPDRRGLVVRMTARTVLAMVALGWRQLRRDPLGLAFTFLLPVAVGSVLVVNYTSGDDEARPAPVGVVAEVDGPVIRHLVEKLDASGTLDVRGYDDRASVERAVRLREVAAGVVVPAGVEPDGRAPAGVEPDGRAPAGVEPDGRAPGRVETDGRGPGRVEVGGAGVPAGRSRDASDGAKRSGQAGSPATIELVGPPEVAAPSGVRAAVEAAASETTAALQLGHALVPGEGSAAALRAGTSALAESGGPGGAPAAADLDSEDGSSQADRSVAFALVATLVLFVFMNTMAGSSALAEYRELGLLARARTTGASSTALAVGYGARWVTFALVQALLVLVAAWLIFGVTWASWPALLVVVAVVAFAAGGVAVVTGTLLPSVESGSTIAGPLGFLLGGLGGALWPLDIVGPALRFVGRLTPHAWAVEALRATGVSGGGLGDVALPLGVLLATATVLLLVGGRRVRRMVERA